VAAITKDEGEFMRHSFQDWGHAAHLHQDRALFAQGEISLQG